MTRAQDAGDRAAQWIFLQESDAWAGAEAAEFESWMAESDGNKAAYWRLKHGWREADRIRALGRGLDCEHEPRSRYRATRRWLPSAVAASIAVMVTILFVPFDQKSEKTSSAGVTTYVTPIGGRRLIGLGDGSRVEINTMSRVRFAVTEKRREVWLDQGEAYFEVRHIDSRPFVVHAGSRQVTVLGTKFSVRRDNDKVTVSVVEGRVRLDPGAGAPKASPMVIASGDTALAQGLSTLVTERVEDQERTLAWRQSMLNFDHTQLSDVAAEFNRYNRKPLIVIGSEASSIRISGVFPADRPDVFVRLLRDAYGFKIDDTPAAVKISN